MPNINLIAQKRQEKARLERLVRRLFFLASGLVITSITVGMLLSVQYYALKGQIAALDEQMQILEPKIQELKEFDGKTAELRPKINLYGESRNHTIKWYRYLQVVARSLPQNTWLTAISPASGLSQPQPGAPPENAVVNLAGTTLSQNLVGETMLSLNRYSSLLEKVDLQSTKEELEGDVAVVRFQLSTLIKDMPAIFTADSAAPKPEAVKAGQGGANANQTKS